MDYLFVPYQKTHKLKQNDYHSKMFKLFVQKSNQLQNFQQFQKKIILFNLILTQSLTRTKYYNNFVRESQFQFIIVQFKVQKNHQEFVKKKVKIKSDRNMTTTNNNVTTATLDDFMDKMYLVPNDVNRSLRLIRALDKRAETLQQSLTHSQARFLSQLRDFKESVSTNGHASNGASSKKHQKQAHQVPSHLKAQYDKILAKQKQLYGYYKQKHEISQQLKSMVTEFYEQLDNELRAKLKEKTEEEKEVFYNQRRKSLGGSTGGKMHPVEGKLGKLGAPTYNPLNIGYHLSSTSASSQQQFTYDLKQPRYCYCHGASSGEMVLCENPFCQREWFHLDCIQQKNLPQKWYCMECQKQKQKTRNAVSRGFFVNRENSEK